MRGIGLFGHGAGFIASVQSQKLARFRSFAVPIARWHLWAAAIDRASAQR
jgi:hypothetical protein